MRKTKQKNQQKKKICDISQIILEKTVHIPKSRHSLKSHSVSQDKIKALNNTTRVSSSIQKSSQSKSKNKTQSTKKIVSGNSQFLEQASRRQKNNEYLRMKAKQKSGQTSLYFTPALTQRNSFLPNQDRKKDCEVLQTIKIREIRTFLEKDTAKLIQMRNNSNKIIINQASEIHMELTTKIKQLEEKVKTKQIETQNYQKCIKLEKLNQISRIKGNITQISKILQNKIQSNALISKNLENLENEKNRINLSVLQQQKQIIYYSTINEQIQLQNKRSKARMLACEQKIQQLESNVDRFAQIKLDYAQKFKRINQEKDYIKKQSIDILSLIRAADVQNKAF